MPETDAYLYGFSVVGNDGKRYARQLDSFLEAEFHAKQLIHEVTADMLHVVNEDMITGISWRKGIVYTERKS